MNVGVATTTTLSHRGTRSPPLVAAKGRCKTREQRGREEYGGNAAYSPVVHSRRPPATRRRPTLGPARRRSSISALAIAVALGLLFGGCARGSDDPQGAGAPDASTTPPVDSLVAAASGTGSVVPATTPSISVDPSPASTTRSPPPPLLPPPTIEWTSCGGAFACGELTVPLHYADPGGDTIDLKVIRLRAVDPQRSLGPLFMNPGGPGGSATGLVRSSGRQFNSRFDVYAFDPRGVAGTHALTCSEASNGAFRETDSRPDDLTEQRQLDDAARAVANACASTSGPLLAHMTTDDAARDLDQFRAAVGADSLTWFGFSYGTQVGLRYAELFPTRLRAAVLDGVVDPTKTLEDLLADQTRSLVTAVDRGFAACQTNGRCATDPRPALDRLRLRVEQSPIRASAQELGPAELTLATVASGYSPTSMQTFAEAVLTADKTADVTDLIRLANSYSDSGNYGTYLGVECTDGPRPVGADAFRAFAERLAAIDSELGAPIANELLPCAFWPAPPGPVPQAVTASGAPPMLVIGTTGDPATPYSYAEAVAKTLEQATLLTHVGEGHTATFQSDCVLALVTDYLHNLTLPAAGTRCR